MFFNTQFSSQEKPCSGCDNTDGKCKASYCGAILRHGLEAEDYISINCHYAFEFLENYPDQVEVYRLANKFYKTHRLTDNIMILVYNELKNIKNLEKESKNRKAK